MSGTTGHIDPAGKLTPEEQARIDKSMEEYRQELLSEGWRENTREFDSLMSLHHYFEVTPQEELDRQWKEIEEQTAGIKGPTVDEYFESLNPQAMYAKGYREGAKKLKELIEVKIQEIITLGQKGESPSAYSIPEIYKMHVLPLIQEVYENN